MKQKAVFGLQNKTDRDMKTMKKIGLAVGLLLAAVPTLQAQFRLTADGFVNAQEPSRRDYVIEVGGADRATLFRKAQFFTQAQFAAPDARFSTLPDEAFAVSGTVCDRVVLSGLSGMTYNLAFRMMFEVRDGAVRVCEPVVEAMYRFVEPAVTAQEAVVPVGRVPLFVSRDYRGVNVTPCQPNSASVIFNPKGDVRNEGAKASLESFFNDFVMALETYLQTAVAADGHTAENALDYWGVYVGTLPAADCEGIRTRLEITPDGAYAMTMEYLGRDRTFAERGTCAVQGNTMTLTAAEGGSRLYFQVGEGRLVMLDQSREPIVGALQNHYVLTKE